MSLVVEDLECLLQGRTILSGVTFEAREGELLGVVGPNGAGKSTLLKCLNGLLPSTGRLQFRESDLRHLKPRQMAHLVALMPQHTTLGFPFSAAEVVMLGRYPHQQRFQGETFADLDMVAKVMAQTDTRAVASRPVDELSGGERQRVLFAKTLAQDTPVVLLDEPSSSLDLPHQEQMFDYAAALAREGRIVIAAVHDLRLAAKFCQKILLMGAGRVLAAGTAEEVLTAGRLAQAYGVEVLVYRNPVTGDLDFYMPGIRKYR